MDGASARRHLPERRRIRAQFPELFKGAPAFEADAQPTCVVESSIQVWQVDARGRRYPLTSCQMGMPRCGRPHYEAVESSVEAVVLEHHAAAPTWMGRGLQDLGSQGGVYTCLRPVHEKAWFPAHQDSHETHTHSSC